MENIDKLVLRLQNALEKFNGMPLSKGKVKPWDKPEAKDKPNHARDPKKWAAARAAATRKYGTKKFVRKKINMLHVFMEKKADIGQKKSFESYENELEKAKSPAWQRAEGKNPKGGLNAKGRASARAEGHNLKPPVLHAGNSLAKMKRQYSFLSRMSGNPGPERDENGKPTRLLLSLQVWGASSKADAKRKAASLKRRIEAMGG